MLVQHQRAAIVRTSVTEPAEPLGVEALHLVADPATRAAEGITDGDEAPAFRHQTDGFDGAADVGVVCTARGSFQFINGQVRLELNAGHRARVIQRRPIVNQGDPGSDARLDGKFVLRTSTDLPADEVALTYRSLWRVERTFRETKSTLEVRPLFHRRDDACVGHIVACFLALRLEVDLQRKLDEAKVNARWSEVMAALDGVRAIDVTVDDQRFRARTEIRGLAHQVMQAVGVGPPPLLTRLESPASPSA